MSRKFDHIGRDTPYHCKMCGHHHCLKCNKCHRCECEFYIVDNKERKKKRKAR
jgi:hypothetical protein